MELDQFAVLPKFSLASVTLEKEVSQDFGSTFSLVEVPTYNPITPTAVYVKPYCIYKPVTFDRHIIPIAITAQGAQQILYFPFLAFFFRGNIGADQQYAVDQEASIKMSRLGFCTFDQNNVVSRLLPHIQISQAMMLKPQAYRFGGFDGRPAELVYLQENY